MYFQIDTDVNVLMKRTAQFADYPTYIYTKINQVSIDSIKFGMQVPGTRNLGIRDLPQSLKVGPQDPLQNLKVGPQDPLQSLKVGPS